MPSGRGGGVLTYAAWGRERHGLQGEDAWRFAVSAHRYGQNSQTCLDGQNKRVLDVEAHMRRNGLWYGVQEDGGGQAEADGGEQTEAAQTAAPGSRLDLGQAGCRYSQAERLEADAFDCSSLVARAYAAQGVVWGCRARPCPAATGGVRRPTSACSGPKAMTRSAKAWAERRFWTWPSSPGRPAVFVHGFLHRPRQPPHPRGHGGQRPRASSTPGARPTGCGWMGGGSTRARSAP